MYIKKRTARHQTPARELDVKLEKTYNPSTSPSASSPFATASLHNAMGTAFASANKATVSATNEASARPIATFETQAGRKAKASAAAFRETACSAQSAAQDCSRFF